MTYLQYMYFIEPTCAQAWWAHMRHFLSVCLYVTGPKFRLSLVAGVTKFGTEMHLDAIWVERDIQGHRSKVKVTGQKIVNWTKIQTRQ